MQSLPSKIIDRITTVENDWKTKDVEYTGANESGTIVYLILSDILASEHIDIDILSQLEETSGNHYIFNISAFSDGFPRMIVYPNTKNTNDTTNTEALKLFIPVIVIFNEKKHIALKMTVKNEKVTLGIQGYGLIDEPKIVEASSISDEEDHSVLTYYTFTPVSA